MSTQWYYLEGNDESNKKGPFSLSFLLANIPSNSLVSNDEMLKSNKWVALSDIDNQGQIISQDNMIKKTVNNHNKQIQIVFQSKLNNNNQSIDNTSNGNNNNSIADDDNNVNNDDDIDLKQKQKQKQKEEENQKKLLEQEDRLKKQVLNIKSTDKFDEEWFIFDNKTSKSLGPFTRWELVKKVHNQSINADTITFLNGSSQWRYLKMCGELIGILPFIERTAKLQINNDNNNNNDNIRLTKDELEKKQFYYRDQFNIEHGPVPLTEIFYNLEEGTLGRNSQIRQLNEICWKTIEFIQNKFKNEWNEMKLKYNNNNNDNNHNSDNDIDIDLMINNSDNNDLSDIESDIDENEKDLKSDPSFRALIDLDKSIQRENKFKQKYPDKYHELKQKEKEKESKLNDNQKQKQKQKQKRNRKRKRDNVSQNCSIYVTGLPSDITQSEMIEFFSKVGLIATDIYNRGAYKIKLYSDGDGLVTYHKSHSVKLAFDVLDEDEIRNGYPVHLQLPQYNNNNKNGNKKKKRRKNKFNSKKENILREMYGVESQLSWDDNKDNAAPKLHWIILTNMFTLNDVTLSDSSDRFFNDLKNEIILECGKIGKIDKIRIYENNPRGIIGIKYLHPHHAAGCIKKMNRRYFDQRIIDCFYWDGIQDYEIHETAQQQEERFKQFQQTIQNINHTE